MGISARTFFPVKNSSDIIFFALNITVEYIQDNILAHWFIVFVSALNM